MRENSTSRRIPLAIPGPWKTPQELHRAALEQDPRFELHGDVLHFGPGQLCVAAFHESEPEVTRNFRACASSRFPIEVLDRVEGHTSIAMAMGMELSPLTTRGMQLMADSLLQAGGFAVMSAHPELCTRRKNGDSCRNPT